MLYIRFPKIQNLIFLVIQNISFEVIIRCNKYIFTRRENFITEGSVTKAILTKVKFMEASFLLLIASFAYKNKVLCLVSPGVLKFNSSKVSKSSS